METGSRGTFAIAWSDSEIDGLPDAPIDTLAIGVAWTWHGRAVRVDGPQDLLVLDAAHGAQELHARAARMAGRLAGPLLPAQNRDDGRLDPDGPLGDGFTVTDGRRQYAVAILRNPANRRLLLAFPGAIPPPGAEYWVTGITGVQRRTLMPERQEEICFTGGTRLRTPRGEIAVEEMIPGDRVLTRDDGPQDVLWIGHSQLTGARLHVTPDLRPIRIRSQALDGDIPEGELIVSPHHRVLLGGRAARALFGTDEVLVAARDLINDRTITVVRGARSVTYYHLLFARHQVLWANGVATESFHPAEAQLGRIDGRQRDLLYRLFPELVRDPARYGAPARRMLTRAEAAILRSDMAPARPH